MRKHNYLVGYKDEGECVYGKKGCEGYNNWIDLLTLKQARKLTRKYFTPEKGKRIHPVIYKLIRIKKEK